MRIAVARVRIFSRYPIRAACVAASSRNDCDGESLVGRRNPSERHAHERAHRRSRIELTRRRARSRGTPAKIENRIRRRIRGGWSARALRHREIGRALRRQSRARARRSGGQRHHARFHAPKYVGQIHDSAAIFSSDRDRRRSARSRVDVNARPPKCDSSRERTRTRCGYCFGANATASISTRAPFGKPLTSTVARAGNVSAPSNAFAYSAFTAAKSFMSVK